MDILCIFPTAGCHEKVGEIVDRLEKGIITKLIQLGANPQIITPGPDYKYVQVGEKIERVSKPKGELILDAIKSASKQTEYVIACDGSGAIPYENIVDIFQALISDPNIYCAMINRVGQEKAIPQERFLIEQFEIFALKKTLGYEKGIPDGQGGLWGFYTKDIEINGNKTKIILTAKEYDIELDLLSEVIEKGLGYIFVPISLPPREVKSQFPYEKNIAKMNFLINKYPKLQDTLKKYLSEFLIECGEEIKKLNIEGEKTWGRYKKDILSS